jgi:hypothetical protein
MLLSGHCIQNLTTGGHGCRVISTIVMPVWGGFSSAKQNQQTCRLAGLCGHTVKMHVSNMSAPSYAEVQKNPMAAMQAVLKQCSGG